MHSLLVNPQIYENMVPAHARQHDYRETEYRRMVEGDWGPSPIERVVAPNFEVTYQLPQMSEEDVERIRHLFRIRYEYR